MLLLSTPFDPAAAAPPRPSLPPFSWTALAAARGVGGGAAVEMGSALPPGLGHALALGAAHGGLLGLGWLLATGAAPGWPGPVLRLGLVMPPTPVVARRGAGGA